MGLWPPRAAEVVERGGVRVYPDQPESVPALIERAVDLHPGAPAADELGGRSLTYEQLWEESAGIAASLQRRFDVEPGERVAFLAANCLDLLVGILGTWRAGAVAVTLNTKYTRHELERQLEACGVRVVFAEPEFRTKAPGARLLDEAGGPGLDFDAVRLGGGDPALIMFTSGTTGVSKPAAQSHLNLVSAAETWVRCLELTPEDTTVVAAPLFHVTGLNGQSLPILAAGGRVSIMARFDAGALVDRLEAGAATFFHAAPTIYVLATRAAAGRRAGGLRICVAGGSPVSRDLVDRIRAFAPGVDARISYGMTETSSPAVLTPPGWIDERPGDAVGVAVPVDDVRVDGDGEGEILFRGATVIADGWLRSGDLGTIDQDGFVSVLDRLKDVINRGAEKIASLEVEQVLCAHPAVAEAAVVAKQDPVYGEVPRAVVVLAFEASSDELREFAAGRLAKFKVPVEIDFVDELPRNPAGKVLKAELR